MADFWSTDIIQSPHSFSVVPSGSLVTILECLTHSQNGHESGVMMNAQSKLTHKSKCQFLTHVKVISTSHYILSHTCERLDNKEAQVTLVCKVCNGLPTHLGWINRVTQQRSWFWAHAMEWRKRTGGAAQACETSSFLVAPIHQRTPDSFATIFVPVCLCIVLCRVN